jgi:hypothetical protein
MLKGKLASLGGVVAALVLGAPALAAPFLNISPFGDNRGAPTPQVARYVAVQGSTFIFDRAGSGQQALLKFDDDPEVWVLQASPAPGGGTIYKNDAGEPVLRITRVGGVTLFTSQEPEGMPVSLLGDADDLLLPTMMPMSVLLQRATQASFRTSRVAQHLITFDVPGPSVTPSSVALFSDAFAVAADAIMRLGRRAEARPFLAQLDKVQFVVGPKPDVSVKGPVMTITVVLGKGFAGRPSSDRVFKAALKH